MGWMVGGDSARGEGLCILNASIVGEVVDNAMISGENLSFFSHFLVFILSNFLPDRKCSQNKEPRSLRSWELKVRFLFSFLFISIHVQASENWTDTHFNDVINSCVSN